MRPSSVCFLFPCCFSFICRSCASRLSSRHTVLPCVSFRAFRCVVPLIVSPVGSSRLVVSFSTVSFCCSLIRFVCRGGFALRSRAVLVSLWRIVLFSLLAARLARHLDCSSRFCPVISFSLVRWRLGSVFMPVPVFAPFYSARRSFLFVNLSRSLCLCRRGAGDASWRAVLVCSSRLISPVSLLLASLVSLLIGMREDGDTRRRSMLLAAHSLLFMPHHSSHLIGSSRLALIAFPSPRPRSKQEEANGG